MFSHEFYVCESSLFDLCELQRVRLKTGETQGGTRSRIFRKEESQKLFVDLSGNVLEERNFIYDLLL